MPVIIASRRQSVTAPRGEPDVGLEAWMAALAEQVAVSGRYDSSDVVVSGDLAVRRFTGRLTLTPKVGGDPITERVKGLHVRRKQADGSWKITQDVWNVDEPAPTAGAGN